MSDDYDTASRESIIDSSYLLQIMKLDPPLDPPSNALPRNSARKNHLAVHTQYCCATLSD